jgi:hypothetical protein
MNPSKVSAVWMHLSPAQVICLCVTPVINSQRVLGYLPGVRPLHMEHVQLHWVVHNQGADQIT